MCETPLPVSLTTLRMKDGLCRIREPYLEIILQLPALHVIQIEGFGGSLQHDWSSHQCSWKQLTIHYFHMVDLGKLPLHSLKEDGCLKIQVSSNIT
jgi:hypothetical protein